MEDRKFAKFSRKIVRGSSCIVGCESLEDDRVERIVWMVKGDEEFSGILGRLERHHNMVGIVK